MKRFSFPVWVLVNSLNRREEGYPHYLLIHFGPGTGHPATLSVFSSEENAKRLVDRYPFLPMKMEWNEFFEALLNHRTEIDKIIFNTGSGEAEEHTVSEALELLRQDPDARSASSGN